MTRRQPLPFWFASCPAEHESAVDGDRPAAVPAAASARSSWEMCRGSARHARRRGSVPSTGSARCGCPSAVPRAHGSPTIRLCSIATQQTPVAPEREFRAALGGETMRRFVIAVAGCCGGPETSSNDGAFAAARSNAIHIQPYAKPQCNKRNPCAAHANATAACVKGACQYTCDAGYHDVSGSCVPDYAWSYLGTGIYSGTPAEGTTSTTSFTCDASTVNLIIIELGTSTPSNPATAAFEWWYSGVTLGGDNTLTAWQCVTN